MPVSINIVDHPAEEFDGFGGDLRATTVEELFYGSCSKHFRRSQGIIQTSFTKSQLQDEHVFASSNSFVWAAYHAYSKHHHLRIRPEDVWFAIIAQIGFFINAHPEELRDFLGEHQGQKHLEVELGSLESGYLATLVADMMAKNVKDPELRDWLMPAFTTTKAEDSIVGSILFMGVPKSHPHYPVTLDCGLPSVTLFGEKADWENIYRRLDKLDLMGQEPALFAKLLRPILKRMIMTFDAPTSPQVIRFWNTIAHRQELSSGTKYITGWLTAFSFWNEQGKANVQEKEPLMDDVAYLYIELHKLSICHAFVPVLVHDNEHEYEATMVAGSVGILASPHNSPRLHDTIGGSFEEPDSTPNGADTTGQAEFTSEPPRNVVEPLSGWFIYEDEPATAAEARAAEYQDLSMEFQDIITKSSWTSEDHDCLSIVVDRLNDSCWD
ncbi:hypothetical protein PFICI_09376 [Pestalotiopsis fici W106-1]|uniref:Uncharacterized protein n=1 Tax=Pestalotiopsis fici (strain W106-1 / CGMCC3.15140) TaxID=1229662 RepID=W3X053_PESFW|nr:uncharacterized protein PFICI_09376 [Pestalotiopsis fici W106-1]ETS79523.1 hypothetical protein PFICI_09376 [Pestalotiopsis fici W106-1]